MESFCSGFDFTIAMRQLCADMVHRLSELSHIDVDRVAFSVRQTRRDVTHGVYASLTPLRFESGSLRKTINGHAWEIEPLRDSRGTDYLYILSFYLPRFQNVSLEEKLTTVIHELWHIGENFDGDLRRHEGRFYVHGPSQTAYDAQMEQLCKKWLSLSPPEGLFAFLNCNFAEMIAEHGRVVGTRWPVPKLLCK